MKFKIRYDDPETGNRKEVIKEFDDWTGDVAGNEMTISAQAWADDYGYTLADKGWFTATPIAN